MIGRMRHFIQIASKETRKDHMGIGNSEIIVHASVRAAKEDRRGSEKWKNLAAYSTADSIFKFRKIPGLSITTSLFIICQDAEYDIFSVHDIRGMYVEVLAEKIEPSIAI